jgi:beta-glucosidase
MLKINYIKIVNSVIITLLILVFFNCFKQSKTQGKTEKKVEVLLKEMTLEEKIGQLVQKSSGAFTDSLIKSGGVGSVLNEVNVEEINRIQRIAMEESRLGIPLIFGRDVIHGFKTIMPIPLGQAATWNLQLVKKAAEVSAIEARSSGIRWTFGPMIDVTRDPRWGRIAESFGEDPYLTSVLGVAAIKGYQGENLSAKNSIAACTKHFAAYGAAEAGRDYNTVTLPENELRDVYLPPFKAATEAGVATIMTAFNEINGVPASGNNFLTRLVLRSEWNYNGMVVSDWSSIQQLVVHGYASDEKDAAFKAISAGVDMEMASTCYEDYLKNLVETGKVSIDLIDESVRNVLELKFRMGLFENPYTNPNDYPKQLNESNLKVAKEIAKESFVLLKNDNQILPLQTNISSIAVIGPLADQPHDQLGTWVFDGNKDNSITPLEALTKFMGSKRIHFASGMQISRSMVKDGFSEAVTAASMSDVVVLFLGEESILSGESHCRADISLPGLQKELIDAIASTGKPIVGVVMAGRPITFEEEAKKMDAILYAWHPGTMAGPAIQEILFGFDSPSGKLPVTFPRTVGQIPVYYAHKNSGKPATNETWEKMYDIPIDAFQLSIGNTNHYLDYGFEPWFPFGYGLSYTTFNYSNIKLNSDSYALGDSIRISATITNVGNCEAWEVAQLYIQDLVGSRTRPVKELKGFKKVFLKPNESKTLEFTIHTNQLGFYNQQMEYVTETGEFKAGVGCDSRVDLPLSFTIINKKNNNE